VCRPAAYHEEVLAGGSGHQAGHRVIANHAALQHNLRVLLLPAGRQLGQPATRPVRSRLRRPPLGGGQQIRALVQLELGKESRNLQLTAGRPPQG
jgi:hypothetical protein